MGLGATELIVILLIVVLLFGASKILKPRFHCIHTRRGSVSMGMTATPSMSVSCSELPGVERKPLSKPRP